MAEPCLQRPEPCDRPMLHPPLNGARGVQERCSALEAQLRGQAARAAAAEARAHAASVRGSAQVRQ